MSQSALSALDATSVVTWGIGPGLAAGGAASVVTMGLTYERPMAGWVRLLLVVLVASVVAVVVGVTTYKLSGVVRHPRTMAAKAALSLATEQQLDPP
jgi:ABC-type branched-subunit amino acid transport system permease subunit